MYIDPLYIMLVIPAMLIALLAQGNVSAAFAKYKNVHNQRGLTGYDVARKMLDDNGLGYIQIEQVAGSLTDHFDPTKEKVRLSQTVYNSTSVAAIGVAAHEVGHALQYSSGYFPVSLRKTILPVTKLGSTLAMPLALLGIIFSMEILINVGILLFVAVVLFQLITLPVEFNASRRALNTIKDNNILTQGQEYNGAKRMLTAAALTYVAALIVAIANLIRLIALSRRR